VRFKSNKVGGFRIFAVAGVNTISFAVEASADERKGLLGFSVERFDPKENERFTMPGFKVFPSIIPKPTPHLQVSTTDHPVQSFLWDDFTAKPDRVYEYTFQPLRGKPKNLDRSAAPITIRVRTEPLFTKNDHDVFFNRGVASSQAYERKFGNKPPDKLQPKAKQKEALDWLTRDLDEAIVKFIESAGPKDTLLCCFYEFHYMPVVKALAAARTKVKSLQIIVDAKDNSFTDKKGKFHKAFPRTENLAAIDDAGIPDSCIIKRDRNPSDIQHNKFMVLLKGAAQTPTDVWTGSTNISLGGFSGQTNVGHWVRNNRALAAMFKAYWDLLATNPGSKKTDDKSTSAKKKKAYRTSVEGLLTAPTTLPAIGNGTTAVFSPRAGETVLDLYVDLVDKANDVSCITLAFGVNEKFKTQLKDNTKQSHITFLLLEQKDKPNKNSTKTFVAINASNNVYKAWGSFIRDPVYQWARETNARFLQLNTHVAYIHSKFLLHDPLGSDPIVVTGSANFSAASTNSNDENMLVIRGNRRVADIYFTEFNRLFNHYYFRAVTEDVQSNGHAHTSGGVSELFLKEKPEEWLSKYAPGKLKAKRLKIYTSMTGFTTL
jgi:phosphatidylserine/phosphatidylglycerophosphate/cardiolipin synthase-like enzyme